MEEAEAPKVPRPKIHTTSLMSTIAMQDPISVEQLYLNCINYIKEGIEHLPVPTADF